MKTRTLVLDDIRTGVKTTLQSVDLTEGQTQGLFHFLDNMRRLQTAEIFKKRLPSLKKIKWDEKIGMEITITDYEERDLNELLHLSRPLVLSDEPYSFRKTIHLVRVVFRNQKMEHYLRQIGRVYEHGEIRPFFQFSVGGKPLFDDRMLNNWLNATEFHQDLDKQTIIRELEGVLSAKATRSIFVVQFIGRIKAIFLLKELVLKILPSSIESSPKGIQRRTLVHRQATTGGRDWVAPRSDTAT